MKFEDLLMQPGEEKQTLHDLQEQVERLEEELDGEVQLNRVLQCAMKGPVGCCESCSCLSPFLPIEVQMLLAEVAIVEEEIEWLERKINELKSDIYQEKKQFKGLQPQWERQLKKFSSRRPNLQEHKDYGSLSTSKNNELRRYRNARERRASLGSSIELQSVTFLAGDAEEERGNSRSSRSKSHMVHNIRDIPSETVDRKKLSEQLIKCLIGIFLKLNQTTYKSKGTTNLTKNTLNCINSKGLVSKATFSCRPPVFPFGHSSSHLDPYEILPEPDVTIRDIGPYKDFTQITARTLDASRLSECLPDTKTKMITIKKKISTIYVHSAKNFKPIIP
ncbi:hypothetical protein CDL12_15216 [Handroanthus impetiginosus]|uniref:Ternary complex factor MIP1 leucine-zipper domain-containing protein n=1 Tax=Handroanthus impetiginosus TaxID=429701 RepID=A0A2G9H4D8_9LAMI|nr:hypothetical protein CDL12_15216 [Handroanthus impetiginosus]